MTTAVTPKAKAQITVEGAAGPTRRTVEALLREMSGGRYRESKDSIVLRRAKEELEKKLTDTPEMQDLERRISEAYQKERDEDRERNAAVEKVRRAYYARGLTPAVVKMVQDLVDKYEC
jgi:microcompartment protein CcmL/EutN